MKLTPAGVATERERLRNRERVVPLLNQVRDRLGEQFGTDIDHVTPEQYQAEVDEVFTDGDRAVNVAAYARLLRELDVDDDYPGFVVDEVLGRKLAATIAGGEPLGTLAAATFHGADMLVDDTEQSAGADKGEPARAAGADEGEP
ncbi:MAG: hypothetical protein V5A56_15150, partial [Halolamina sp.]